MRITKDRIKIKGKSSKETISLLNERRSIYDTSAWRKLRLLKLKKNPLCEKCEHLGIIKAATQVHHIESFVSNEYKIDLAYSISNLCSLCAICHQAVHNKIYHDIIY